MNIRLNKIIYLLFFIGTTVSAQQLNTAMDSTVTVQGRVNIKGKEVKYKATTGKQPVWDDKGKIIAGLFFTYYQRTDVDNIAKRPLVISFNA